MALESVQIAMYTQYVLRVKYHKDFNNLLDVFKD